MGWRTAGVYEGNAYILVLLVVSSLLRYARNIQGRQGKDTDESLLEMCIPGTRE